MIPHYVDPAVTLYHGDCLDVLRTLPDASVDAVVTDPPYGLGFMGKAWDDLPPGLDFAAECLRVLKPGGHVLAFGGTRTWHRLACAVEDAGFEVRDSIAWLYGSGFPKSRNLDGDWQGWGTALKPAFEPIVVARKPLVGTVTANVLAHGTGALNVDGCRIGTDDVLSGSGTPPLQYGGANARPFHADAEPRGVTQNAAGRWPANVVLDESQATELDRQSGDRKAGGAKDNRGRRHGLFDGRESMRDDVFASFADTGGASRFFYVAKAPTAERPRVKRDGEAVDTYGIRKRCTKCGKQEVNMPGSACDCAEPDYAPDPSHAGYIAHPTVKPLDLMRWLVRLVTPPGGVVLEPFAGSGTTAEACVIEGFRCIAIEREADYLPLIVARLTKPIQPSMFGDVA